MWYFIWGLFLFIIFLWIFVFLKFSKKKKLSKYDKKEILKNFKKIKSLYSFKEKMVDYDKLYYFILKKIWYKWSFWEILKSEPKHIKDLNKIWELHKIRNKLVHDFSDISENDLKKKVKEYEKEIEYFLKIL